MSQSGIDLMNQINTGELRYKDSNVAVVVKEKVTTAMDEILTMGARVRPLKLGGRRVGWLRPLAYSERRILDQLIEDEQEKVILTLSHCTTLSEGEILDLDIHELNSILHRIYSANLGDLSLFPYISAYVTTQASQNYWASQHDNLFARRIISLPDGKTLKLLAAPDHIMLWATLSKIRANSILRLEDTLNFSTLIKAQVGKSAEKYVKEIVKSLNQFQTDLIDPWVSVVDFVKLQAATPEFNDGFGHSHEDTSVQGMLREMDGMFNGDKHEQIMQDFYNLQLAEAKNKEQQVQIIIEQRRAALDLMEDDGAMVVVTDAEVRRREREMQSKTHRELQQHMDEMADQDEVMVSGNERVAKYY